MTFATTAKSRRFAGRLVRAECVQPLLPADGPNRTLRWPSRSRALKVRLPSNPGSGPVFCSVITASLKDPIASISATLE